jgi:hypothetical protein
MPIPRLDGRKPDQLRTITFEADIAPHATAPATLTASVPQGSAVPTTRASGSSPCRRASASDMTTSAAAPSLSGALVAAVIVPIFGRKAGSSDANC